MEWGTFALVAAATPSILTSLFGLRLVGLTGTIASGKSTTTTILREQGAPVLDFDHIARIIVYPGAPVLKAIEAEFGPSVIKPDGSLDRAALGAIVFGTAAAASASPDAAVDPAATAAAAAATGARRARLNSLMRPALFYEFFSQLFAIYTCSIEAEREAAASSSSLAAPSGAAGAAAPAPSPLPPSEQSFAERTRSLCPSAPQLPWWALQPLSCVGALLGAFFPPTGEDGRSSASVAAAAVAKVRGVARCLWGAPRVVVIDTPLLFESGIHHLCSDTVVVAAGEPTVLRRLMARDKISQEDAKAKVAAQLPLEKKKKMATHLIDNSEDGLPASAASAAANVRGGAAGAPTGASAGETSARFPALASAVARYWQGALRRGAPLWLLPFVKPTGGNGVGAESFSIKAALQTLIPTRLSILVSVFVILQLAVANWVVRALIQGK